MTERSSNGGATVIFDWGDTLMRDLHLPGPMAAWPRVETVPGAGELLAALQGRAQCCVASGSPAPPARTLGRRWSGKSSESVS